MNVAHSGGHIITQVGLACSLLGAALTFIILLSMKKQTQPASFVLASNMGTSGWSSDFAWALGVCNAL
ncbi:hypothetical protein BFJ69_g14045 [Fusarium oxysporum]|uniref:Uncharacterized protein n=1 Tax=Fusarium oxysporum TaxID=5507 RepID=A0A420MIT1_FUSOX|nr:hypothetical protein BFJ69_g14045 [Fusarium oxysporum]